MENDTHPDLNKYALTATFTKIIAGALLLVSVGFIFVGFISIQQGISHDGAMAYPLSAACLAIAILSEILRRFLLRYNEKTFITPLKLASRLMRQSPPKEMAMSASGVHALNGSLVGLEDSKNTKFPALFPFSKIQKPSSGEHPVEVYFDPTIGGKTIAMRLQKSMIIGRHLTYTEIMSESKLLKRFIFATIGIFAVIFVLGSVWKYYEASSIHALAVETRSWTETDALIISSEVEEKTKSIFASRGPKKLFRANVTYSYMVAGKKYISNSPWPSYEPSPDRNTADKIIARYPAEKEVRIHYKPSDPSISFLEAGHEDEALDNTTRMKTGVIAMIAAGIILFLILFFITHVLTGKIAKFAEKYR
ncbi:MAG: DUF3592 domain-containing protein [Nitrospirae bacterium]|nr:DUF3592 domain-containing protein [Nitrospirota bacterium]